MIEYNCSNCGILVGYASGDEIDIYCSLSCAEAPARDIKYVTPFNKPVDINGVMKEKKEIQNG